MTDEAVAGGANRLEKKLEWWSELCGNLAIVCDKNPHEQRLVHPAPDLRRGLLVGVPKVGNKSERRLQVVLDNVKPKLESREPLLDMVELSTDAFLLNLKKFEGNRVRVVGLQELGALVKGAALPANELLTFEAGVLA